MKKFEEMFFAGDAARQRAEDYAKKFLGAIVLPIENNEQKLGLDCWGADSRGRRWDYAVIER